MYIDCTLKHACFLKDLHRIRKCFNKIKMKKKIVELCFISFVTDENPKFLDKRF